MKFSNFLITEKYIFNAKVARSFTNPWIQGLGIRIKQVVVTIVTIVVAAGEEAAVEWIEITLHPFEVQTQWKIGVVCQVHQEITDPEEMTEIILETGLEATIESPITSVIGAVIKKGLCLREVVLLHRRLAKDLAALVEQGSKVHFFQPWALTFH